MKILPQITIRPVRPEDYEQWLPLWEGYNKFYGRETFPIEITQMTWQRFLDEQEPMYALVAEQNGELVGLAHYLFHRSTMRIGLNCYLHDLYIDPQKRKAGIGRALIEAVYQQAKLAGAPKVYWQTQEDNIVGRKLYDKLAEFRGFIVYEKMV